MTSAHAKKCPVCLNMTGHMTKRCFEMSSPVNRPNPDCRCLSGVQPPKVFPQRPDHSDHFLVLACRAEKDAASSYLTADGQPATLISSQALLCIISTVSHNAFSMEVSRGPPKEPKLGEMVLLTSS